MKKVTFLIFVLLGILSYSQNCNEVKTGKFIIENKDYGGSILIRTASSQEEIIEKYGLHTKYDLVWIDDCHYVLFNRTLIKGKEPFPEIKKTDSLFIEIKAITPQGYKFKATSNFSDFITEGIAKYKKSN